LFIAGVAATILSTLDSFLFICSSTLGYDLFGRKFSQKNAYKIGRLIITSIITFLLAGHFVDDIDYFYKLLRSYCGITLAIPMMCTIFFKNILSEKQFIYSILLASILMFINDYFGFAVIENFYLGALINSISIMIFALINNIAKR
jgi:SSS family solute:Na+ symporter